MNATHKQLHGPDGAMIELDRTKVVWDDPGIDTPAIVHWKGYTGTYTSCLNTGEIECGEASLPDEVMAWLDEVHEEVHDFLYSNPPPEDEEPAESPSPATPPPPIRYAHVFVQFRAPNGALRDDHTSYSMPGALEAAEEDAHRYGWELVQFKIIWQ